MSTTAIQPLPFINHLETAPAFWQNDALWTVMVSADETLGMFTLLEQLMPEKNGPPPIFTNASTKSSTSSRARLRFRSVPS